MARPGRPSISRNRASGEAGGLKKAQGLGLEFLRGGGAGVLLAGEVSGPRRPCAFAGLVRRRGGELAFRHRRKEPTRCGFPPGLALGKFAPGLAQESSPSRDTKGPGEQADQQTPRLRIASRSCAMARRASAASSARMKLESSGSKAVIGEMYLSYTIRATRTVVFLQWVA